MTRFFVLIFAAAMLSLPALAEGPRATYSADCACGTGELAGGPLSETTRRAPGWKATPQTKIINITPKMIEGLTIHRGGEVTYTSPNRRIYATSPNMFEAASRRLEPRPSRVETVGNTRIVYAPEAFRPVLQGVRED